MTRYAAYIRTSTTKQTTGAQSQRGAILEWFADHDVTDWDEYADAAQSGADDSREAFRELLEAVRDDRYDDVVMIEISRLARRTALAADFIDVAVDTDTTIHLLDEMIDAIDPDDRMSAFFAKQLSLWYEEERRQTIARIQRGQRHAQREGKWVGQPPTGFATDDEGYLVADLEEFLAFADALERVDDGESYRGVARDTRFNRVTLMNIHNDDQRRRWYLDTEADDQRVSNALTTLEQPSDGSGN